jgi:hypothetical protein
MSSDSTYGSPSGTHPTTIEYAENAIVAGVSAKKVFPIVLPPTAQTNPSLVLGYTGADLTTITKTIGTDVYVKTLGYTGSSLTSVSAWVKQ